LVDTRINGRGERLFFKSRVEADAHADILRTKRMNDGKIGVQISERLRIEALECDERLKPFEATLRQACDFFLKHFKPVGETRTCAAATAELIDIKRKAGKRESYMKGLGWALGKFNKEYGEVKVSEIAQGGIEEWLDEQEFKLATRRAYIRDLGILFAFCNVRGYCSINPVARIEKPMLEDEAPEIFTVDEAAALLHNAAANPDFNLVPILAIGMFEVTGKKAKTRQRRLVKISDNLASWLTPYRANSGKIVAGRFRERLADTLIMARAELAQSGKQTALSRWPKNGMRHSFASYHLAYHQNAALAALELGHADTAMLFAHYRNLVRPKEAARYWQIVPQLS
jgi:integrase